jgi:K+/H+ antiporter YhaU regulatory subunit KhtT
VLEHLRLDRARALVVAISDATSTRRIVALARTGWPHLTVIARTRYLVEVEELYELGASEVVPEETVTEHSLSRGRSLAELDLRRRSGASVIARVRDGGTLANPGGEETIEPGDTLVLLGTNAQVERALAILDQGPLRAEGFPPASGGPETGQTPA